MLKIALTGPSGAGKGYVGKLLESKGYAVLDTDAVVHTLYKGGELPIQIGKLFGEKTICPDGSVARKELGKIVFSDPSALSKLNELVHAVVRREVMLWLEKCRKEGHAVAFVDAPQLFEAKMEGDFDLTVAVVAEDALRLSRICARDGITVEMAQKRMQNQMSADMYSSRCDYTIHNDVNTNLQEQVDTLIKTILK